MPCPPSSRREEVEFEHAELAHDLQEDGC